MKVAGEKWKKMLEGHRLEILMVSICVLLSASIIVYAFEYLWSGSVGATITTEVENIKVYDQLGNEVTSINFGNLNPSSQISVRLSIKNTSPNATITINWRSTLSEVTTKITDVWRRWFPAGYAYFPVTLGPGDTVETEYIITVSPDCPLQTYSWTLYVIPG